MLPLNRGKSFGWALFEFPSNAVRPSGALLVWIVLFFVMAAAFAVEATATEPQGAVNCEVHNSACTQVIADTSVTLDISPKPVKAMAELRFKLTLTGEQPSEAPFIDLGMPGMKMGPNRIDLKPLGDGMYAGTGIIVRCPSGKRTWKARVTVPKVGAAEFIFDVIY